MFYLNPEDWSPRFDDTFYTVKIVSHGIYGAQPPSTGTSTDDTSNKGEGMTGSAGIPTIQGKTNHPAMYYKLEIQCGHKHRIIYRRYSHFRWLYNRSVSSPPPPSSNPHEAEAERKRGRLDSSLLPPKTISLVPCMPCIGGDAWRDDDFVEGREEALGSFMRDLLTRRGYADHSAVVAFLELDGLVASG